MFKKITACALAVLLLLTGVTAFADEDSFEITPVILPELDMTATAFYASADSRVLFVTGALIEVIFAKNEPAQEIAAEALIADRVYVAKNNDILSIYWWGDNDCLLLLYRPSTNEMMGGIVNAGGATITNTLANSAMTSLKNEGSFQSYYKVDGTAVITLLSELVDSLE